MMSPELLMVMTSLAVAGNTAATTEHANAVGERRSTVAGDGIDTNRPRVGDGKVIDPRIDGDTAGGRLAQVDCGDSAAAGGVGVGTAAAGVGNDLKFAAVDYRPRQNGRLRGSRCGGRCRRGQVHANRKGANRVRRGCAGGYRDRTGIGDVKVRRGALCSIAAGVCKGVARDADTNAFAPTSVVPLLTKMSWPPLALWATPSAVAAAKP